MVWSTVDPPALRSVTRRLYRNGSSGDQRRALGTGTANSVNPPVAEPTTVAPFIASARTLKPLMFPRVKTRSRRVLSDRFGVRSTLLMELAGAGSSQTVCQMPELGV